MKQTELVLEATFQDAIDLVADVVGPSSAHADWPNRALANGPLGISVALRPPREDVVDVLAASGHHSEQRPTLSKQCVCVLVGGDFSYLEIPRVIAHVHASLPYLMCRPASW